MAQRVQSKAKSNKKRRQNQKRRKNAAAASRKLQLDAASEQKEGKMAAVIRMFSPRSSGNGTGGSMASLFSPNAKKTKSVKKVEIVAEPVEEIPSIEEAPSADTADVTVGTAESMEMEATAVVSNVMAAVEAEAEVVEGEEEKPVNLLGKNANSPSDECNLQQCIIL